jgi:RNA polymerase primary sigma factor
MIFFVSTDFVFPAIFTMYWFSTAPARRYEPSCGYMFTTYSMSYVKFYLLKELASMQLVHVPARHRTLSYKLAKQELLGTDHPDEILISESTGRKMGKSVTDGIRTLAQGITIKSLSSSPGLAQRISDPLNPHENMVSAIVNNDVTLKIKSWIDANLDKRSKFIIEQRYMYSEEGDQPKLEDLGNILGISRERVRQLESKALNRLRRAFKEKSI